MLNRKRTLIVSVLSALCTGIAWGEIQNETAKFFADDGAADDLFGSAMAVDGNIAIIGAQNEGSTKLAQGAGAAYVVNVATQQQLFKLTPSDGAPGDLFGDAVAISGSVAIVGALGRDDNGSRSGAAYLFDVTSGQQLFKLLPADGAANDTFGFSVAISGTTAIVGAPGDDDVHSRSGSVYAYDTTTGQLITKFRSPSPVFFGAFGVAVAIDGNTAVIGSDGDTTLSQTAGAAHVYDATTWQRQFRLLADDFFDGDEFGGSVAISGTTTIIGAAGNDDNGSSSGAAYLFDTATGQQLSKLLPGDGSADDQFGESVGISGNTAIVGARATSDSSLTTGTAYFFEVDSGVEQFKLRPTVDSPTNDQFGASVAISGANALVGAHIDSELADSAGAVYSFVAGVPGFNQQPPKFVFVDLGAGPQELQVQLGGATPFGYQWMFDGSPIVDGGLYSGTTTDTLTIDPLLPTEGTYEVVVTNPVGQSTSTPTVFAVRGANPLIGDINGDGIVDTADLGQLISVFGMTTP